MTKFLTMLFVFSSFTVGGGLYGDCDGNESVEPTRNKGDCSDLHDYKDLRQKSAFHRRVANELDGEAQRCARAARQAADEHPVTVTVDKLIEIKEGSDDVKALCELDPTPILPYLGDEGKIAAECMKHFEWTTKIATCTVSRYDIYSAAIKIGREVGQQLTVRACTGCSPICDSAFKHCLASSNDEYQAKLAYYSCHAGIGQASGKWYSSWFKGNAFTTSIYRGDMSLSCIGKENLTPVQNRASCPGYSNRDFCTKAIAAYEDHIKRLDVCRDEYKVCKHAVYLNCGGYTWWPYQ